MASDGCGCKPCVIVLFILLSTIGVGIYYRKEIEDYRDPPTKFIYRNETQVHTFFIKKYHRSGLCSPGEMKIYAANDSNRRELYRIDWYQSENMTLTQIKDEFIVSQAQRINKSSYSFKLFSQSKTTTGKMSSSETNQLDFDIEYTNHIHETLKLMLHNRKELMKPLNRRVNWMVEWFDMNPRPFMNGRRLNIEKLDPDKRAYLHETFESFFYFFFASPLYPYIYNLYVLKYLPDEFYLTTLIIADHGPYGKCD
jgi:hypothetical protein